jgi:DNA-binding response OmpR family regulator
VRAVLRRSAGSPEPDRAKSVGGVRIDPATRSVSVQGDPVHLTSTEFDLLMHLMSRPGRVYTRDELLSAVWGYAAHGGTRTVDVHVAQVRGKLGDAASIIRTVRGVGYTADA